jgi:hypothetical protein
MVYLTRGDSEKPRGEADWIRGAEEFEVLSRQSNGNSAGWKFDRDEIHERKSP